MLTSAELKSVLHYDPETGVFTWLLRPIVNPQTDKTWNARYAGGPAGWASDQGYIFIDIHGARFRAHHLAWLVVHGEWPKQHLDHINGHPADNRIANLREATRSQNMANARKPRTNTSGFKGVSLNKRAGKWEARIRTNGHYLFLGHYDAPAVAHAAYCAAATKYRGEFARME